MFHVLGTAVPSAIALQPACDAKSQRGGCTSLYPRHVGIRYTERTYVGTTAPLLAGLPIVGGGAGESVPLMALDSSCIPECVRSFRTRTRTPIVEQRRLPRLARCPGSCIGRGAATTASPSRQRLQLQVAELLLICVCGLAVINS